MTVAAAVPLTNITAAAGQTDFPFTWRCDSAAALRVYIDDVLQGGPVIVLNPDQVAAPGGVVTLPAQPVGAIISIERALVTDQTVDVAAYGLFSATLVEDVLDRVIMRVQELSALFQRTFRVKRSVLPKIASFEFPSPILGFVPSWVDAGGGLFKLGNVAQAPAGAPGPAGADGAAGPAGPTITPFNPAFRMWKAYLIPNIDSNAWSGIHAPAPQSIGGTNVQIQFGGRDAIRFDPAAAVNASAGYWYGGGNLSWTRRQALPKLVARVKLGSLTLTCQAIALCGGSGSSQATNGVYVPTIGGTNADTAKFAHVGYDSRVSANFIMGSGDGVTASWLNTGVPANLVDEFLLIVDMSVVNVFTATIINCTTGVSTSLSKSTNLWPAGDLFGPEILSVNFQAAAKLGIAAPWLYMEHNS